MKPPTTVPAATGRADAAAAETHESPGAEVGRAWIRAWDVALAAWASCWIVLALIVATEVRGLGDLSRTVITAGSAVEQSGEALGSLEQLPIVGEQVAAPAERVIEAGRQAQESGRSSRESIRRLAVLLGVGDRRDAERSVAPLSPVEAAARP
jgi:hypothetical protein